jgi:nicotinamide mononucleotide (NMN) deamidase PncC
MEKKQLYQYIGAGALLLLAAGVLVWSFTRSDVEALVISNATLKGKVTYKSKPVSNAMIIVAAEGVTTVAGVGYSGNDGSYLVQNVPIGKVQIGINTDAGKAMMRGATIAASMTGDKSNMPVFSDVPKKYFNPESSGVSTVLSNFEAENTFDIEL